MTFHSTGAFLTLSLTPQKVQCPREINQCVKWTQFHAPTNMGGPELAVVNMLFYVFSAGLSHCCGPVPADELFKVPQREVGKRSSIAYSCFNVS